MFKKILKNLLFQNTPQYAIFVSFKKKMTSKTSTLKYKNDAWKSVVHNVTWFHYKKFRKISKHSKFCTLYPPENVFISLNGRKNY